VNFKGHQKTAYSTEKLGQWLCEDGVIYNSVCAVYKKLTKDINGKSSTNSIYNVNVKCYLRDGNEIQLRDLAKMYETNVI
jgi:hypothetical protein